MNQVLARHYYSRSSDPLDRDEEIDLARRIGAGDEQAMHDLVSRNFRFVVKVAHRYKNMGLPLDDLISEGCIGLMIAAKRFDTGKGVRFITYAAWWIRNSMQDALTGRSRVVRLPERERVKLARIREENASVRLTARVKDDSALERGVEFSISSLDDPVGKYGGCLVDILEDESGNDPEEDIITRNLCARLAGALEQLDERRREIVLCRFGLEGRSSLTLEEIGHNIGVSRERVRQLEKEALEKLRLFTARPQRTGGSDRQYPARS